MTSYPGAPSLDTHTLSDHDGGNEFRGDGDGDSENDVDVRRGGGVEEEGEEEDQMGENFLNLTNHWREGKEEREERE